MALIKFKLFGKEISTNGNSNENPFRTSKEEEVLAISVNGDLSSFVDADTERRKMENSKLVLCPRCQNPNTKFCYFNNYSVNQPRHFCKNCQRYWTAGGALRNVPEGSGSRKKSKGTPYAVSETGGSAKSHKSSSADVARPLRNQSVCRDRPSPRDGLPKGSKDWLNDSAPIDPFHFPARPCPYGYGLGGIEGLGSSLG